MKKLTVSIIGFGRFGQLLAQMLAPHFDVCVHSRTPQSSLARRLKVRWVGLEEALKSDTIIYAVPINALESTLQSHLAYFWAKPKTLIDVLSVKLHARDIFLKHAPEHFELLLTHPMFGPDSVRAHGVKGLPIVIDPLRCKQATFRKWKSVWRKCGLKVIEMNADTHDRLAAYSQGITHFVGRVLEQMKLQPSQIDTIGAQKLLEIIDQVSHDSHELFLDLQRKNPYTRQMRKDLKYALMRTYEQILPHKTLWDELIIGIQGGHGSFNEKAVRQELAKQGITHFQIRYLYTTENVLEALAEGEIDIAQFAIYNLLGGIVEESLYALASFGQQFEILSKFSTSISYHLMIQSGVDPDEITDIYAHPIALEQCKHTLMARHPNLLTCVGAWEFIDVARLAEEAKNHKLDRNIALLGPATLKQLYDLQSIDQNLEDQPDNFTYFLWIKRKEVI